MIELDWLQSFKQVFIHVPYHIIVASSVLQQNHQTKTSYKCMIWHIDEKLF